MRTSYKYGPIDGHQEDPQDPSEDTPAREGGHRGGGADTGTLFNRKVLALKDSFLPAAQRRSSSCLFLQVSHIAQMGSF